jgi:hypothetical protein
MTEVLSTANTVTHILIILCEVELVKVSLAGGRNLK